MSDGQRVALLGSEDSRLANHLSFALGGTSAGSIVAILLHDRADDANNPRAIHLLTAAGARDAAMRLCELAEAADKHAALEPKGGAS